MDLSTVAEHIDGWENELAERDKELQDDFWRVISIDWTLVHATRYAMREIWELRNDLKWQRKRLRAYPRRSEHASPPQVQVQQLRVEHAQLAKEGTDIASVIQNAFKKAFVSEVGARFSLHVQRMTRAITSP